MSRHNAGHTPGDCHKILRQLNDYVDNALPPICCVELESHLADCDNCQTVLDTLRKTIDLAHQLQFDPAELPPEVEERLFVALNLDAFDAIPASGLN